ncbi:hypothetical protein WOLCODRAFT_160534 [Wolfiporia cocos MD-104 SS10]|uniref:Aminoglycoside phosphotransferase domain-containing protein n=1 Tax=Wolfiporia cocos (strain MD-104) TaxID=742152 RepID=A0A2H3IWB0_WOLCO|nr:hypothetical protein WOLCODRAFT_160534 [Wolfiporia cocos MD-104 SS10]
MPDPEDLTTTSGVINYLSGTAFDADAVTFLTGGSGNFAYRVHLRTPYDGYETVVVKHAEPYVRGLKTMAFSLERQLYEVEALQQMIKHSPPDALVTVPEVLHFDTAANVIIMTDCGDGVPSLKQLMQTDPPSPAVARTIGKALGTFIGRLHARGRTDDAFRAFFDKNEEGKRLSALVTYGRLVSTLTDGRPPALCEPLLEVAAEDMESIERVVVETEREILNTKETVVMGDFWPGNVLVSLRREEGTGTVAVERIYVIDWELAKVGLAGLDVGQFCAEVHLLGKFHEACEGAASAMLRAFLHAYGETDRGTVDIRVAQTVAVHVGAHWVAWTPRVPWGAKEKVREVVCKGIEYLVQGQSATDGWIKDSILAALLQR